MTTLRPLLAYTIDDISALSYPLLGSFKIDGVRALVRNGVVLSRRFIPIPNQHVQYLFGRPEYEGLDGELCVGAPNLPTTFAETTSAVRSVSGQPDITFHIFDRFDCPTLPFILRAYSLRKMPNAIPQYFIKTMDELARLFLESQALGFEGVVTRAINGEYKFNRSTAREQLMGRIKTYTDAEFLVIGVTEREYNANELTYDERGYAKRSTHKANKHGRGDLGALILQHPAGSFMCGTGFTDSERQEIYNNRSDYIGRYAKVRYMTTGIKTFPRHPVFLGWRASFDL